MKMSFRRSLHCWASLLAVASCFQFTGCASGELGQIVVEGVRNVAVEIGTFLIDSAVDESFGLR